MKDHLKEVNFTVSIADKQGTIIYLNDRAAKETFKKEGGYDLIGTNVLDCHPEPSKSKLSEMMKTHDTQTYFKGEGEAKRLIHQTPIYEDGKYAGYIELIIPLRNMK
jgi:transcriptional regulator with PAS, ATPase and Fis domain